MVTGLSLLWSDPTMRRAVILFLAVGFVLRLAAPAVAFHGITPPLLQIPPEGENPGTIQHPHWGGLRYVLFDSDADPLGTGSTGRQLFFFDLRVRDTAGDLAITQLTSGPGNHQRPRTGRRAVKVAFEAQPGGAGPSQIMLVDRRTGVKSQLTAGASSSLNPAVDDGERIIVFESSADFFGTGAGGTQIYKIDLRHANLTCPFPCLLNGNGGLTQITNKTGNNRNASTSNSGKVIVFESDADLLNQGQTENQIYLYDGKNGSLTLLSHGPGAARNPSVTRDGGSIVFESDANLTGGNPSGTQLFLHRRNKAALQQLTAAPGGACTKPAIASDGHAVAFLSSDNLLGLGTTGPEVYSYNLKKNYLVQLTNAPANVSDPSYSSGVFSVFLADGDIAGNGSPGTQLYLINLFALGNNQTVP